MKKAMNQTKMYSKKNAVALLLLLFSFLGYSQTGFTVSGTVLDEFQAPLPGASIVEKGTTNGVSTDFDGNYTITVSDENAVLVVTYIGYGEQELEVKGQSKLNVALEPTASALDEVVLVGYGSVKKKDLTGAISQINTDDIPTQSPNSVTDILRAAVPGLSIGFASSAKGVSNIEVRGSNGVSGGSRPLVVVDGMIFNGDLADINPNDIQKVDVMKDASSAAVYGARGSNGVILITSKRGTSEKPTINLSTSVGVATVATTERPYTADEYVDWRTDVFKSINPENARNNPGRYDNPNNLPAGVTLEQWLAYDGSDGDPTRAWLNRIGFQDVEIENYLAGNSIDWYDRIIQNGFRNDVNLSLSGRKGGMNYYWSIGRTSNEGLVVGDKFETLRSRLNLEGKITDYLTVGINAQYALRDEGFISADRSQIWRSSPWGSEFDDEGNIRLSPQDDSGAGAVNAFLGRTFNDRLDNKNTLNTRMFAKLKLPLGFSYELAFSNRFEFREFYNHLSSRSPANTVGRAQRGFRKVQEWQLDNILRWNKTINKHGFDIMLLFNSEKYKDYFTNATANTFEPNDDLGHHSLGLGTVQQVTSSDQQSTGDALMTRVNYNFDSKYLITWTMRRDGYSAFGNNNKRGYFPSIAGGWTISEEDFFKSSVVDFLKLRVSYGQNGNRNIFFSDGSTLNRYAYLSRLGAGKYLNVNDNGDVFTVPTLNNFVQENSDLKWESTKATNLGLDFSLKDGAVSGSLELYRGVTSDLFITRLLPNIIGFSSVLTNLGEIQNEGMEFSLNTRNIDKENFKWNTNFNFAINRNKVNSLYGDLDENGNELDDEINRRFIGKSLDVIWDKEILGIWQEDEAAEAERYGVFPGDFKLRDVNNDGVYTNEDNVFQGNTKPNFVWGMTNSFTFLKNLDFSFDMYSQIGQKRLFNIAKNRNGFIDRTNSIKTPYWTPENPRNDYARLFSSDGGASFNVYRNSSFVRLNNITISYRLPSNVLDSLGFESCRVYGNVRNVFVWSPEWDFYDPQSEAIDGRSGLREAPRYFTLGINLSI